MLTKSARSQTPSCRLPSYRHHKPSGQAVVTLNGRDIYLGKWGTAASRTEYDRLLGEWLAAGRRIPVQEGDISVAEVALAYLQFANGYYVKNGVPTGWLVHNRLVLRELRKVYGHTLAIDFGPLAMKAFRQRFVEKGHSRAYINKLMAIVVRMFKWAASEQMIPSSVHLALDTVEGLRKGRCEAPDHPPVEPVPDQVIEATLPFLGSVVADMVRFQRYTGARPAEVCLVRPCDVDTTGDVWHFRPGSHKTEHHGRDRVICIGPKGQEVLRPYLLRAAESYCFSPVDSERKRREVMHERRTTSLSCGNRPGSNRKRRPKRSPGDRYTTNTYRRAIHRAVDQANRKREEEAKQTGAPAASLPKWSPNRLRHTAATEIRSQFGLEAAQVALGHAQANVTQVYAERDLRLASEVARKIG